MRVASAILVFSLVISQANAGRSITRSLGKLWDRVKRQAGGQPLTTSSLPASGVVSSYDYGSYGVSGGDVGSAYGGGGVGGGGGGGGSGGSQSYSSYSSYGYEGGTGVGSGAGTGSFGVKKIKGFKTGGGGVGGFKTGGQFISGSSMTEERTYEYNNIPAGFEYEYDYVNRPVVKIVRQKKKIKRKVKKVKKVVKRRAKAAAKAAAKAIVASTAAPTPAPPGPTTPAPAVVAEEKREEKREEIREEASFSGYVLVPRTFGVPAIQWQYATEVSPTADWRTVGAQTLYQQSLGQSSGWMGAQQAQTYTSPWQQQSSGFVGGLGPWNSLAASSWQNGIGSISQPTRASSSFGSSSGSWGGGQGPGFGSSAGGDLSSGGSWSGGRDFMSSMNSLGHWEGGKWEWNSDVDTNDPTIASLIQMMNRPGAPSSDSGTIAFPGTSSVAGFGSVPASSMTTGGSLPLAGGLGSLFPSAAGGSLSASGTPRFTGTLSYRSSSSSAGSGSGASPSTAQSGTYNLGSGTFRSGVSSGLPTFGSLPSNPTKRT